MSFVERVLVVVCIVVILVLVWPSFSSHPDCPEGSVARINNWGWVCYAPVPPRVK